MATKSYTDKRTGQTVKEIDWNKLNSQIKQNRQQRQTEIASKSAEWEQARKQREAQKQTESAQRQAALAERRRKSENLKIEQATAEFNKKATSQAKGHEASQAAQARRESNVPKNVIPQLGSTKPSSRYENQNISARLNTPQNTGRDKTFDKDFENFYEYRYNKADTMDYNPTTDTSTEHWRNLKEEIKKKNKWTDAEFDKRWNAYDKERMQNASNQEVQTAIDVAKNHPVLGTLLQAAYNPQTWIEGGASILSNLLPEQYKAQTADDPRFTGTRVKEGIKQSVKDNNIKSNLGKGLYDLGTGLGDMVMAQGIPVLGTATLGANAAANTNMQALERGVDPTRAAATGAVAGVASGFMNKIGLDKALGSSGKTALQTIGKAALKEGAENVLEDAANYTADTLINQDKSQLSTLHDYYMRQGLSDSDAWKQVAKDTGANALTSFGTGAIFGGAMSAAGNIPRLRAEFTNRKGNSAPIPQVEVPEARQTIDALDNTRETADTRPNIDNINREARQNLEALTEAVQKQTDDAQRVIREAEPIEQYTQRTLRRSAPEPTLDDLNNAFETMPENTGLRQTANAYSADAIEDALDTNQWIRQGVANAMAKNEDKLTDTARKNYTRLNTALDNLDEAIRRGDDYETIKDLNKEVERAYGALDKNLQRLGSNDMRSDTLRSSTYFGGKSEANVNNILNKGRATSEVPLDADGFIDTDAFDVDDMPFNELQYDQYGRVMPDTDGLRPRRGVNVQEDMGNSDAIMSLREPTTGGENEFVRRQKLSKGRSNTLERAGYDNAEELKDVIPESDFMYWEQSERETYEAAKEELSADFEKRLEAYTKKHTEESARAEIGSAKDVDEMMLLHAKLNEMARNATDPLERKRLYAQSEQVAVNSTKVGREGGRIVQAFAKHVRTAQGAIMQAQGRVRDLVENGLKRNPRMADEIGQTAKDIDNFLDGMDNSALTRKEIEDMVTDAINRRKMLRQRVTKGDIQTITDAIMNEKQYCDVQKQLEFLSTGFRDIDEATLERVQDIFEQAQTLNFNSKERVDLENEAYKLLADRIAPNGGSMRDKIDAWRYLAMLANPTTHIKNMTGNELFGGAMVSTKNTLGAMIEEAADRVSKATGGNGIERTKAILTPADKPLVEAAREDALQNAYRELSGNKYYGSGEGINNAISAFSNKTAVGRFLNKASDINGGLLNKEDEIAVLAKYRTSLAGFLKANGADASIFNATDDASKKLLESGRAYAINQAKEAAFHQDSEVANAISNFAKTLRNGQHLPSKIGSLVVDVTIPFKKTPINVLESAIEYSPAEFVKCATDIRKLNKGLIKPAEFIDDLSKGITGTAALGLGALLAHEGILKIGSNKTDEEKALDSVTGRQNVALKVGNKYVGLSELIPAAAPFILGATIFETMADSKGEESALNTMFSGMSAITNGVTDMTMLSGIADTLNSVRFADTDANMWENLLLNETGNLASQMLPTLGRKIGVTADDTKRSTYSDQTGAWKTIDQNAKYLQTKIPGLQQVGELMQGSDIPQLQAIGDRFALQPAVDAKGQIQDSQGMFGNNNIASRFANNFLSPVSTTTDTSTAYDEERRRLVNATGETKVLPYIASSEATIDGSKLSPSEWTAYRQQRGQMREDLATSAIQGDYYNNMSDEDKAEMLKTIDSFSKAYSQAEYGKNMSTDNAKLADLYEQGGTEAVNTRIAEKMLLNDMGLNATDKNIGLLENGGTENLQQYLDLKDKVTTTKEDGKTTIYKADLMNELRKLPKEEQEAMYNAFSVNQSKAEAAAYEKGGANAAIEAYFDSNKTKKTTTTTTSNNQSMSQADKVARVKALNSGQAASGDVQAELASYGAIDSKDTVKYYEHAKETIPSLTPKQYANTLHTIGGDDYKIQQDEMLNYFNNNNLSNDEVIMYWNAYGNWKTIPYLKSNGTWGKKKK